MTQTRPDFSKRITALLLAMIFCAVGAHASTFSLDLSGSNSVTVNTGIYGLYNTNAGSGVYTRMYATQNNGTQAGYNADTSLHPFDQKSGVGVPQTDLGDMPIVTVDGTTYIQLLMDFHQTDNAITLTEFRVYIESDPSDTDTLAYVTTEGDLGNLGTLVYDMDGNEDNTVSITNIPGGGSGASDLQVLIPVSYLMSFRITDNIYFWTKFTGANSTPEEMAIWKGSTTSFSSLVPEPGTVMGGALVALLVGGSHFRRGRCRT